MAAPTTKPRPLSAGMQTVLDKGQAFRLRTREVLRRLIGRGVPADEAEDLAQEIAIIAWQRRHTYDSAPSPAEGVQGATDSEANREANVTDRGQDAPDTAQKSTDDARPLRAWIWGIAKNMLLHRGRAARKDPLALMYRSDDDRILATLANAENSMLDLRADLPLARLDPMARRIFCLHFDAGSSFEEIAASERQRRDRDLASGLASPRKDYCTSKDTARRCWDRAIKHLEALVGQDRQRARGFVPIWLALFAGADELPDPPPEMVDRVVARAAERLGFEPTSATEPPPSGRRLMEPRVRPARSDASPSGLLGFARLARWLAGMVAGVVVGVLATLLVLGPTLPACDHDGKAAAPPARALAVGASTPAPARAPELAVATSAPAPRPAFEPEAARAPVPDRRRRRGLETDGDGEPTLYLRAAGLADRDAAAALAVLLQERERYPRGALAAQREALVREVCAALRPRDARCPAPPSKIDATP